MSTISYVPFESSIDQRELGLRPRLLAAGWFACAAAIPVIFFCGASGGFTRNGLDGVELRGLLLFAAMPVSAAALFGFRVGSRIVDPLNCGTVGGAALRGMWVAFLSYLLFIGACGVLGILAAAAGQSGSLGDAAGMALLLFVVGMFYVGWLVLIVGAVAGMVLFVAAEQGAWHSYLVNSPRATVEAVNRWTVLMSMPFLAGCLVCLPSLLSGHL